MDPKTADAYWKPAPGETALLRVLPSEHKSWFGQQLLIRSGLPILLPSTELTARVGRGKSLAPLPVKLRPRIANVSVETIAALTPMPRKQVFMSPHLADLERTSLRTKP